jgi:predicted MFS family arabinose efflux permease
MNEPRPSRPAGGDRASGAWSAQSENFLIASTVFITFVGYATIALPLAVVPIYVHTKLGYGTTVAGFAVSLQYVATVLSRARVGQMADTVGPKITVLRGLAASLAGGGLMVLSGLFAGRPALGLGLLLPSRLALGIGESLIGTGAIAWAIGRTGPHRTARIISWNGIATYGALVLGAPLGVVLTQTFGFASVGWGDLALGAAAMALALSRAAVPVVAKHRLSSGSVLWRILPYGSVLALASAGFGTITTFITLFFHFRGWSGAAFCLSAFGLGFILVRALLADTIGRFGGVPVAAVSLAVQTVGLLLVWLAGAPDLAIAGSALAGAGFSLVFPSLAVEAMARVPAQSRGAAIGLYSVFLDVALGIAGPAAGLLAVRFSYAAPFLFGALATATGLGVTGLLRRSRRNF